LKQIRFFGGDPHDENARNGPPVVVPAVGLACFVNTVDSAEAGVLDVKPLSEILSSSVLEIGSGGEQQMRDRSAAAAATAQHQALLIVQEEQEDAAVDGWLQAWGGRHAARLPPSYLSSKRDAAPWVTASLDRVRCALRAVCQRPAGACTVGSESGSALLCETRALSCETPQRRLRFALRRFGALQEMGPDLRRRNFPHIPRRQTKARRQRRHEGTKAVLLLVRACGACATANSVAGGACGQLRRLGGWPSGAVGCGFR
jgi:hypothetical protein